MAAPRARRLRRMEAVKKAVSKGGPSNPTIRRDPPQLSGGTKRPPGPTKGNDPNAQKIVNDPVPGSTGPKRSYVPDSRVGVRTGGGVAAPFKRPSASPMRKAAARTGTTLKQRTQGRLKALGGTAPTRKKGEDYNAFAQRVLTRRRVQKAKRIGNRAYNAYKQYNATK